MVSEESKRIKSPADNTEVGLSSGDGTQDGTVAARRSHGVLRTDELDIRSDSASAMCTRVS